MATTTQISPMEIQEPQEDHNAQGGTRKRVVVVGLGMVGIAFMWVRPCLYPMRESG